MAGLAVGLWDGLWSLLTEPWVAERDMPDQFGKVAIVTGGTAGTGYEIARQLAAHQAHVIIAARNVDKARRCIRHIKQELPWAKIDYLHLDLSSFRSVAEFAAAFKAQNLPLHMLINNAGEFLPPPTITEDGFDRTLQVNYYSPALLSLLLLDVLKATAPSRIVNMGSQAYLPGVLDWRDPRGLSFSEDNWGRGLRAYCLSKLMLLMWTQELQSRLKGTGVDVFTAHPGLCKTEIGGKQDRIAYWPMPDVLEALGNIVAQRPRYGAQSVLYAATDSKLQGRGGKFIGPTHVLLNCFNTSHNWVLNPQAWSGAAKTRLYQMTLDLLDESTAELSLKPRPFADTALPVSQNGFAKLPRKVAT